MLVLSRRPGETIVIADGTIVVTILEVHKDRVRIGIAAPSDIPVHRSEIQQKIKEADACSGLAATTPNAAAPA